MYQKQLKNFRSKLNSRLLQLLPDYLHFIQQNKLLIDLNICFFSKPNKESNIKYLYEHCLG